MMLMNVVIKAVGKYSNSTIVPLSMVFVALMNVVMKAVGKYSNSLPLLFLNFLFYFL